MLSEIPLVYQFIGLSIIAYLSGSIPFGYLLGRLKGIDLRAHGSKNIGATNAARVLGKKFFFLVLFLDAAKGFLPTLLARQILFDSEIGRQWIFILWLMIAFAAIAGHLWPCWLKFRGGKGVATSLGVVLAIYPYYAYPGLIALVSWLILVKATQYVSLGSIVSAVVFVVSYLVLVMVFPDWSLRQQWPLFVFAVIMAAILIIRHWKNIDRLRKGTESKFKLQ